MDISQNQKHESPLIDKTARIFKMADAVIEQWVQHLITQVDQSNHDSDNDH